jgi:FkbM family methyltransferase
MIYQPVSNPEPLMTQRLLRAGTWRALPMRIIDGGARWGAETHWDVYGDQLELFAFEPDEEECRRMMAAVERGPDKICFTCEPLALARARGRATINVARFADASSLLPNNEPFVRRFAIAPYFEQVSSTEVDTTSVDSFLERRGLEYIDFMKLDVEGAELDVLRGAENALNNSLLGLSVEVWFHEVHTGRPLFSDIDAHLRGLGFVLFDLRQLNRWRRRCLAGQSYDSWIGSGQLMYGNALYPRDLPARLDAGDALGLTSGAVAKLASLAELFCYPDFAVEVIESGQRAGLLTSEESQPLIADLRRQAPEAGTGGWRVATRRTIRAAIPPAARRRLMSVVQDLITE